MHRIAVLLLPPVVGFDATIAPLLFGSAADGHGDPLYEVTTCAVTPGPVAGTGGYAMLPEAGPEALAHAAGIAFSPHGRALLEAALAAEAAAD